MEFDEFSIGLQPTFSFIVEPVTWAIVDDDKQFLAFIFGNQLTKKLMKCMAAKNRRKAIGEVGVIE